jgi:octaprenyl-diphosphate synthase
MSLTPITNLIQTELHAVNETILHALSSPVDAIKQIGHYLINSGGKRIRPLVVLLSSKACEAPTEISITMSAIIEFIHTATLLHDDVVDGSALRRGRPTANHVWDNASAVLVGDFLYSRAFQLMVSVDSMPAMRILADATNTIAEGEVLQLAHRFQPDVQEDSYFNVIRLKTAKLFEAAAQLGAIMGEKSLAVQQNLGTYGMHLGTAFQLVDDVLDYQAASDSWGKNIGADLSEGKTTLPLIYALKEGNATQSGTIRSAIKEGNVGDLAVVQEAIVSTGAIDYTMRAAQQEIQHALQALEILPNSEYREALASLAHFAISRGY